MRVPSVALASTSGERVDLSAVSGRTVVYVYPRTGRPGEADSEDWDAIPGARGCTPQSCGFRDRHDDFRALGVRVFGLSTQTTDYQHEAAERLGLPFPLLSDAGLAFGRALRLPTFDFEPYGTESRTHLRRMAIVIRDGVVEKVFHPVFPPDRNAADVVDWLHRHPAGASIVRVVRAAADDAQSIVDLLGVIVAERVYSAIEQVWPVERERAYIQSLSAREAIHLALADSGILAGLQILDRWSPLDSMAHVGQLGTFVHPEWRTRGVGRALWETTQPFAVAAGYQKLVIQVRASNLGAQRYYRALGFAECGTLTRQVIIDGQPDDEILLELFL
jgi:peroxiredoxin/L-amino acid N-acyltransferase YncA